MWDAELAAVEAVLGEPVTAVQPLTGGFSHETSLVTAASGAVVVRAGGAAPHVEAAVMRMAGRAGVPVPRVLRVVPARDGARGLMIIERVPGRVLEDVLTGGLQNDEPATLGQVVGRVLADVGRARFRRPGFFLDATLEVRPERAWSRQLPDVAAGCMAQEAAARRLDERTRRRWVELCAAHAPALERVDGHARLVHADANPKNVLVTRTPDGWRVDALLDWEFAYAGCPYGDAANMTRFAGDYPTGYVDAFHAAYAAALPRDLPPDEDWRYLGGVLDLFALSDLVTRPKRHPIADRAAERIRGLVADQGELRR